MSNPDLVKAMSDGIIQESDNWDTTSLHVSDLGVSPLINNPSDRKCSRQLWLRYHNQKKKSDTPGKLLMYQQGHTIEDKAVRYLMKGLYLQDHSYYVMSTQMNVSGGFEHLTGRLDILLNNKDNNMIVVDVKSRKKKNFDYPPKLKPIEFYQVAGYIYGLRNLDFDVTTGCILEADRSGDNFARQIYFEYTENTEWKIEKTIEYMLEVVNGDIPERIQFKKTNAGVEVPWQCEWCDYYTVSCDGPIF